MKRMLGIVLTVLILTAALALPAGASSVTSLYISSAVDQEAVCTVNATVELYLNTTVEELTFTLPEGATGASVTGYKAKVRDGSLVISRDGGFIGTNTFQLSWTVPATVVDNTADTDDDDNILSAIVTIPLQGAGCVWTVDKATFQVSMPNAFTNTPTVTSGYYGDLADEDYVLEVSGSVITGEITGSLIDHEALSISLVVPADYFSVDRTAGSNTAVGLVALLITVLLAAAAELYRRKRLAFRKLEIQERVQPPENVTAGEVPFLLDGSGAAPAALLTQWASLGYLTIINRGRSRTTFHRRMAMGNERKDYENAMFSAMFAGREVCQSTEKSFRRACNALQKPLRRYWRAQVFDPKSGNPAVVRWLAALGAGAAVGAAAYGLLPTGSGWIALAVVLALVGVWLGAQVQGAAAADWYRTGWSPVVRGALCGVLLLVLGILGGAWLVAVAAIAAQVWFGYALRHGARRTETGCELLEQLLGLRTFLRKAAPERLEELQKKQPQYYYDLLPYAEVLGVGRQFSAHFQKKLTSPDWLDTGSRRTMSPTAFYSGYHALIRSLQAGADLAAQTGATSKRRKQVGRNRTDRRR